MQLIGQPVFLLSVLSVYLLLAHWSFRVFTFRSTCLSVHLLFCLCIILIEPDVYLPVLGFFVGQPVFLFFFLFIHRLGCEVILGYLQSLIIIRLGWGVARYSGYLQDLEVMSDKEDSRKHLHTHNKNFLFLQRQTLFFMQTWSYNIFTEPFVLKLIKSNHVIHIRSIKAIKTFCLNYFRFLFICPQL